MIQTQPDNTVLAEAMLKKQIWRGAGHPWELAGDLELGEDSLRLLFVSAVLPVLLVVSRLGPYTR